MRAVVQRVSSASVSVEGSPVGSIGQGFVILLGVGHGDSDHELDYLVRKISGLRVFEDSEGKMNLSLGDVSGQALVISQFTLYADVRKGRRPSFTHAAPPDLAQQLYDLFCDRMVEAGIAVARGVFQAHMAVSLVNDGPVTIWLDTEELVSSSG